MQVAGLVPWPSSGGFIRSHYLATDEPAGGGNMALRRRRGRNCPETGRWVWGRQHGRNPRVVGGGRERGIRPPPPPLLEATFGFLAFAISPRAAAHFWLGAREVRSGDALLQKARRHGCAFRALLPLHPRNHLPARADS
jgi:hypothetical protein